MQQLDKVFGIHAVNALVQRQAQRIENLYYLKDRNDDKFNAIITLAAQAHIRCEELNRQALDDMCQGNHQGIVALCRPSHALNQNDLIQLLDQLDHDPLLLILDGVTDPHNLGACLRTAEAAGADALIVPKNKSASLNGTVRKVACGAADILPFVSVTNLARLLVELKSRGIWIMGAALEGSQSLHSSDLSGPLALVMGAEGSGLRRLTREHCDFLVHIPMTGAISSLNVSVATGVCLFEALRQRKPRSAETPAV